MMDDQVTECPGPDSTVESAMQKIRSVMGALQQPGKATNEMMFARLSAAYKDLESAMENSREIHATESEITDIKRRAGIVEFVPGPEFGGDDGRLDPEGVPLWQRLQTIAKGAQGVGRVDQHQIEEIFRASEVLKKLDR